jgi:CRP/FNR family transcriptional regulator, nitrogen oxide reductase regulator
MYYGDSGARLEMPVRLRDRMETTPIVSQHPNRLKQSALFAGISPSDCTAIMAPSHEKHFARRDTIFLEGDGVSSIVLLLEGCAKVTQLGLNGSEVILRLNVPGDVVGDLSLLSHESHGCTAQALYPCKVLVWEAADFQSAAVRFPRLQRNANQILGSRLQELQERFRQVSTEKVSARLAHLLVRLTAQIGRRFDDRVEINLSREEMAQMIGTTLFTVSRVLSDWEAQDIVALRREAVVVHRPEALREFSEREGIRSRVTRVAG